MLLCHSQSYAEGGVSSSVRLLSTWLKSGRVGSSTLSQPPSQPPQFRLLYSFTHEKHYLLDNHPSLSQGGILTDFRRPKVRRTSCKTNRRICPCFGVLAETQKGKEQMSLVSFSWGGWNLLWREQASWVKLRLSHSNYAALARYNYGRR